MDHSDWELTVYSRHHIRSLAAEIRTCSLMRQNTQRPARLLAQIRHRLGIGLIQIGQELAGHEATGCLVARHTRPATTG